MNRTLFTLILIALSLIAGLFTQPALAFTLTLVAGPGVAGSPTASSKSYPAGTVVPYSYRPASTTWAGAVVVLDGKIVATTGNITMNANHWLFVYGNPSKGTLFAGMITVPSDPTKVLYPQFFRDRTASSIRIANPYCAITSATVSFPANYLGAFPMPTIVGAPLPNAVLRGAHVKDYWLYGIDNPSTNEGCSGDLHVAFVQTLKRLKKLGVDHIGIYRDTQLVDATAVTMRILPAAQWSIPFAELKWIATQAKALGLKVHEYRQITIDDTKGHFLSNSPTIAWMNRFLDAYTLFIVDRAKEAETAGVAAFELDWGGFWLANLTVGSQMQALVSSKMSAAARKVREVYSGKILYGTLSPWASGNATLLANVDYLIVPMWMINFSVADDANTSVPLLKQKYRDLISAVAGAYGPERKPAVFQVYAQSHRNWFKSGWIEDGFCVADDHGPCKQRNVKIDFSIQAIAYEAMLEAIKSQTDFQTAAVDATAYWYVDVMLPKSAFPNLSQSWRNKPAEAILRKWFAETP